MLNAKSYHFYKNTYKIPEIKKTEKIEHEEDKMAFFDGLGDFLGHTIDSGLLNQWMAYDTKLEQIKNNYPSSGRYPYDHNQGKYIDPATITYNDANANANNTDNNTNVSNNNTLLLLGGITVGILVIKSIA